MNSQNHRRKSYSVGGGEGGSFHCNFNSISIELKFLFLVSFNTCSDKSGGGGEENPWDFHFSYVKLRKVSAAKKGKQSPTPHPQLSINDF